VPGDVVYNTFAAGQQAELNMTPGESAINVTRQPVNCANLPDPKSFKKGAKLVLDERRLRPNLASKTPFTIKGKHVEMAFDTNGYRPTCFASNQHNEKQALKTRVLCATQEPTWYSGPLRKYEQRRSSIDDCIDWAKENHHHLFPKMHKIQSVSPKVYLERSNASPSVKRILKKTFERLAAEGITEFSALTRSQLYQYTQRSSFVKVENDLYSSPLGRKHKAPRLIQGATPEFICLVGPWIMALQDMMKRRWSTKNFMCFTSGVTAKAAAEFINGASGLWLEDDLGKFDATIRRAWCEYEVWLCRVMGAPRAVLELMRANIKTHGSTHHGWRYKCEGTRKSGDPYTSVMNSVINGISHVYLYCLWTGKTVEYLKRTKEFRMLMQGDDNLLRHPEYTMFPWAEGMASLGFESEAIYRARRQNVEFCSSRLYETTGGLTFGPKPGRVLSKLGYVINPPKGVSSKSVVRGIALGLKKTSYFLPPVQVVVDRLLQLTEGHVAWYERKQFEAFHPSVDECFQTVDVMLNLNLNYDWDYGLQKKFSVKVEKMELGDAYSPLSTLLFDRDCGGPQQIFGNTHPMMVEAAG